MNSQPPASEQAKSAWKYPNTYRHPTVAEIKVEVDAWKHLSVTAIAAENQSVAEYVKQLEAKCAALEAAHKELMGEAAHDVSEWGAYASEYFQEKWDLKGTVKKWLGRAEGEKK